MQPRTPCRWMSALPGGACLTQQASQGRPSSPALPQHGGGGHARTEAWRAAADGDAGSCRRQEHTQRRQGRQPRMPACAHADSATERAPRKGGCPRLVSLLLDVQVDCGGPKGGVVTAQHGQPAGLRGTATLALRQGVQRGMPPAAALASQLPSARPRTELVHRCPCVLGNRLAVSRLQTSGSDHPVHQGPAAARQDRPAARTCRPRMVKAANSPLRPESCAFWTACVTLETAKPASRVTLPCALSARYSVPPAALQPASAKAGAKASMPAPRLASGPRGSQERMCAWGLGAARAAPAACIGNGRGHTQLVGGSEGRGQQVARAVGVHGQHADGRSRLQALHR